MWLDATMVKCREYGSVDNVLSRLPPGRLRSLDDHSELEKIELIESECVVLHTPP